MQFSKRISSLESYPFAALEQKIARLKAQGIDVIDFGVGDPREPTPEFIREATKKAVDDFAAAGYPSYVGLPEFRRAVGKWFERRFKVQLDPEKEITSSLGSKEAIFNFPLACVEAGEVVICPTPGYPPYARGATFAGGQPYFVPLTAENNFLPDLQGIPAAVAQQAKILWLNYPNSPTGALAPPEFYQQAVDFAAEFDLILAADLAYSELYFGEEPRSLLEFTRKRVIEFHSLSKRSCMTGYRVGFAVGDPEVVAAFQKVKTNIDSGTPNFIQAAAIEALQDEEHVQQAREGYRQKAEIMTKAFRALGLPSVVPPGTFYLWQRVPANYTAESFAERLLEPRLAVAVTPGNLIADRPEEGENPGQNFVRLALVESWERIKLAAERLEGLKPDL